MKKLLLLGGSAQQIIAIETAKKLGYKTIVCDYLIDNPGQYHADKFYYVSTVDREAVLKVAQEEKVDGVLAYASDPAAPTAAYVAEQMGLPGNPFWAVEILCNKEKFRKFLKENGFHTPKAKGYNRVESALQDLETGVFHFPVIVKPIDSSGSRGVKQIDKITDAYDSLINAMSFSRSRCIIVEEFVDKYGYQIAGDGISVEGQLVFHCFADDHFNPKCKNPFVPVSASFPCSMPDWIQEKAHAEIQRLITLLNMKTCTYNFDIRVDSDYNVYLMEVAPRDGGNYIPQAIKYMTGIDLTICSVKAAMGEKVDGLKVLQEKSFVSYYAVHSLKDGVLDQIIIQEDVKMQILENHIIKKPGMKVSTFTEAGNTLGCLLMEFSSMEQMLWMMDHSDEWIEVRIQG